MFTLTCKSTVKRQIQYYVFNCMLEGWHSNRKTVYLRYKKFKPVDYFTKLEPPPPPPQIAKVLIKARLRMFKVKTNFKKKYNYKISCQFCINETETFDHIFQCPDRVLDAQPIRNMTPEKLSREEDIDISCTLC